MGDVYRWCRGAESECCWGRLHVRPGGLRQSADADAGTLRGAGRSGNGCMSMRLSDGAGGLVVGWGKLGLLRSGLESEIADFSVWYTA